MEIYTSIFRIQVSAVSNTHVNDHIFWNQPTVGVAAGTLNQDQITNVFKRCGQFNDVNGRENHLVKIQGVPDYKPPKKSDPWLVDPLKKGKKRKKSQKNQKSKKKKS